MRPMKPLVVCVLVIILGSVCSGVGFVGMVDGTIVSERDTLVCSDELLVKQSFLFGRVANIINEENYSSLEAVNLRVVFFKPFQFFHFKAGETIRFVNQFKGLLLPNAFIAGALPVILPLTTNSIAVMDTSTGTILLELYEDRMPITTENFIRLAEDGFYDGLVFHRVIEDFVIQGGGYYPNGTLKISPYGPIDLEIDPSIHHLDGTIGMARTSNPDSATSQFFIDDGAQRHLEPGGSDPNGYAAFGRVVLGIEIVRAIAGMETMTKYGLQDWPVEDVVIHTVRIVHP